MSLIKVASVKKQFKEKGFRVSKEAFAQLERRVAEAIDAAVTSANQDKRKTIQPTDLA